MHLLFFKCRIWAIEHKKVRYLLNILHFSIRNWKLSQLIFKAAQLLLRTDPLSLETSWRACLSFWIITGLKWRWWARILPIGIPNLLNQCSCVPVMTLCYLFSYYLACRYLQGCFLHSFSTSEIPDKQERISHFGFRFICIHTGFFKSLGIRTLVVVVHFVGFAPCNW